MRYGSVCSGIEAASLAWIPLGWDAAWYAEIEKFPSAVLHHRFPETPNLGDITADGFTEQARAAGPIDLLVGGTPCQSFSVAGLRQGLADPRGNLALHFLRIIAELQPTWVLWENVPGVLSSSGGRDFATFLRGLGECGYGWSYRVLDAQYFGVPQKRRRVFVVGYLGDWRPPAAVLFEPESLQGDIAPRRQARESVAASVAASAGHHVSQVAPPVTRNPYGDHESREGLLVPEMVNAREDPISSVNVSLPLGAKDTGHCIAFEPRCARNGRGMPSDVCPPLKAQSGQTGKGDAAPHVVTKEVGELAVRRLTPL